MEGVFYGAKAFNQDVSSWDCSGVIRTTKMFGVGSIQQFDVLPNEFRDDDDVGDYLDNCFDDYYDDPCRDKDDGWDDYDDERLSDQFSD
jgi:hypothetical protein